MTTNPFCVEWLFHCEVSCHGTGEKEQIVGFCTSVRVFLLLACEQLRFSLYHGAVTTKVLAIVVFLYYSLSLAFLEYPMPYASCLASCSVVWSCFLGQPACPDVLCLMQLSLSEGLGFCSPLYAVHIHTALWDSLSGLCAFWNSLSSFPGL